MRLQETLRREVKDTKRRDARRQSLDELGRLEKQAETIADVNSLIEISGQVQQIAQKSAQDPEVRSMAAGIESRLESRADVAKKATPATPAEATFSDEGTMVFRGGAALAKDLPVAAQPPAPVAPPAEAPFSDEGTMVFRGAPVLSKEPPTPPSASPETPFSDEGTMVFRGGAELIEKPPPQAATVPPARAGKEAAGKGAAAQPGSPAVPAGRSGKAAASSPPVPTAKPPAAAPPVKPSRTKQAAPPAKAPVETRKAPPAPKPMPTPPPAAGPALAGELEETRIREIPKIEMPAPEAPAPRAAKRFPILPVAGGAIVLLLVMAAGAYFGLNAWKGRSAGPTVAVQIKTSPVGARIKVNDEDRGAANLELDLPPGSYSLKAELPGYQTESTTLEVKLGSPAALDLTLQPLPQMVRLYTDLASGSVRIDGNPAGELQGGELILDSVLPGTHSIEVKGGNNTASIAIETSPGALPKVTSLVSAKDLKVVVFTNLGASGRVHTSFGPVKISLDDQAVGSTGPEGLELGNLAPGRHALLLGEGADQSEIGINVSVVPSVTAFMSSDREVGTLVVITREDNVRVLIDGREYRRKTRRGQLRIPNLNIKGIKVQVVKDGFQPVPPQRAKIRKGIETQLQFRMTPVPSVATLQIRGAAPGAQVFIGQRLLGSVRDDGTFSASGITPGDYSVELRREGFRAKRLNRSFGPGGTVRLAGNEVMLEAAQGVLNLNISPADAKVTIALVGDPRTREVDSKTLSLPEGTYILRARAPEYSSGSVSVRVSAGETKNIELKLTGTKKGYVAGWENPGAWTREGNWQMRKGGGFVLYGASPSSGRFVFTISLRRGRRLQWILNHTDNKNYALFQMDKKSFYRNVVRNGSRQELAKAPVPVDYDGYYTVQVRVSPGAVTHEVFNGKSWVTIDSWTNPGTNVAAGKFGFLVQGNDEIGISNFAFYPQ